MSDTFEPLGTIDNPDRVEPVKTRRPKPARASACNVPGCTGTVYHRGLCDEHWATRRDLADPAT